MLQVSVHHAVATLIVSIVFVVVIVTHAHAQSITDIDAGVPTPRDQLPDILAQLQDRLKALGLEQVDLVAQATSFLDNLATYAVQLAGPLQQLAVASLGALANLLIVLILSLYMVVDRDAILSFFFRIVPPFWKEEARLLETSIARSFGGFLRGQAILGVVHAAVAALTSAILGLPYLAVTTAAAGVLMAIPFFGPFVAWAPPVIVALLTVSNATLPSVAMMGVGWLIVMNVLQPRLMQEAVGIHPIVVLGSVLIGSKIAGVTGAIFGIPIAAVLSAFFFHYIVLTREPSPVATRAAQGLVDPTQDPHHQRRRRGVARPAGVEAGTRVHGRHDRRGARHEPERRRSPEDPHATAPRPRTDARRRLDRLLGRRQPDGR